MAKKSVFALILAVLCVGFGNAQSFGSVDNDKAETKTIADDERGFTAQVDIDTNLFQHTKTAFSDAEQRLRRTDFSLINNYPFGGTNVLDDTNIAFGYNSSWYGGSLSFNKNGLGGVKAWLGFLNNKIKISAGNDIGYGYADSQGADAGLRVYDDHVRTNKDDETVDSSKNPDNITQDKGILFEFDLDPVKIAFAGGGNMSDLAKNIGNAVTAPNSEHEAVYGYNFQYGLNIGGKIGGLAKLNGAYILQYEKNESRYEYSTKSKSVVAHVPEAEVWNHLFGLYGSYYPLGNDTIGITLGYAGTFTKNLETFSVDSETAMPTVFKNGLNLTARYKKDGLTIKTDHNYSFWIDKNYTIYYLSNKSGVEKMKDWGLEAKTNSASDVSEVNHSFLWNGIGASYTITPRIEGSVYIRNLLRIDETPEYKMAINYFSAELKSVFRLSPNVEAYGGITYRYTERVTSESLAVDLKEFGSNTPGETTDSVHMFQIPVGFTVKLQK